MKKIALIISSAVVISGCAAIPMDPQAAHVLVSPKKAPKGCKYIGQVVGNQGNFFTGDFTSNRNLEEGAMNDLRNQAAKLNTNYVELLTSRAGMTGSYSQDGGGGFNQTNVTTVGNAYRCVKVSS